MRKGSWSEQFRRQSLVILIFALTPWIGRAGPRTVDPQALPPELL